MPAWCSTSKNISDNASVAININGTADGKFRNGWQFKWNDVDISDGVMMNSTGTNHYNNTRMGRSTSSAQAS